MTRLRLVRIRDRLRDSLWVVPLLGLLTGVALSFITVGIDRASDYSLVSQKVTGTPTDVQQILSTAASALLSLTSVVLSLTLVAVQLAMGQFSPRIVGSLLSNRRSQLSIGLFIGTFAYVMLILRDVNDQGQGGGTVPGVSALVSYVLVMVCIGVLVLFVHHSGQSMRVSGLIDLVGDSTRAEIERMYADEHPDASLPGGDDVILAPDAGNIVALHRRELVDAARQADVVLELVSPVGEFVLTGGVMFRIRGGTLDAGERTAVLNCVQIGRERTHRGDPAYGLRKLVDIAERTIASSPFDDPTTTVQAVHRIHDLLRLLVAREFPDGRHYDADGELRLVEPTLDWPGYVRLAFDELRIVGASSPQVARRLRAALEDLKAIAPPARQAPLDRQLELLEAAVKRQFDDDVDVEGALAGDPEGIGTGKDVVTGDGSAR